MKTVKELSQQKWSIEKQIKQLLTDFKNDNPEIIDLSIDIDRIALGEGRVIWDVSLKVIL
jgi:hypothetical protein